MNLRTSSRSSLKLHWLKIWLLVMLNIPLLVFVLFPLTLSQLRTKAQFQVHFVSVKIGDHNYYGLCDLGSSVSAIPFSLYQEIKNEIQPCEIEDIDVMIHLANKQTIYLVGIVRDVEVLCGKVNHPTDFLVLGSVQGNFFPIIFCRPFL